MKSTTVVKSSCNIRKEIDLCPNLTSVKYVSERPTKFYHSKTQLCTLMLLSNLAEPNWILIPCSKKLLNFIMCVRKTSLMNKYDVNENDLKETFKCRLFHVVVNKKCYIILYETSPVNRKGLCKNMDSKPLRENEMEDFNHIFDNVLIEGTYINIFVENDTNFMFVVKIQKFFGLLSTRKNTIEKNSDGYHICNFEKIKLTIGLNMYHCKKGGYILTYYICDGIDDCPNDNSDEEYCICVNRTLRRQHDLCQVIYLGQNIKICGNNYIMTIQGNCIQITHSMLINKYNSNHHIRIKRSKNKSSVSFIADNSWQTFQLKTKSTCRSGLNFERISSDNIIPDCGVDSDDTELFNYIGKTENNSSKCQPFQFLCSEENYYVF